MRNPAVRDRPSRRDPADPEAAREAALRLLERTRRTRSELSRKLREKGFAPALIEEVLDRLAGVGLVDDVEYARAFLAARLGRRTAGWRRLEMELRRRGISGPDATAARVRLAEQQGDPDEVALARRVMRQVEARPEPAESAGGTAQGKGIVAGEVIVEADGKPVDTAKALATTISAASASGSSSIALKVMNNKGERRDVTLSIPKKASGGPSPIIPGPK